MKKLLILFSFFAVFIGGYTSANCKLFDNGNKCLSIDKNGTTYSIKVVNTDDKIINQSQSCHIAWTRDNSGKAGGKYLHSCNGSFEWVGNGKHKLNIAINNSTNRKEMIRAVYDYDNGERIYDNEEIVNLDLELTQDIDYINILGLSTFLGAAGKNFMDTNNYVETGSVFLIFDSNVFHNRYNRYGRLGAYGYLYENNQTLTRNPGDYFTIKLHKEVAGHKELINEFPINLMFANQDNIFGIYITKEVINNLFNGINKGENLNLVIGMTKKSGGEEKFSNTFSITKGELYGGPLVGYTEANGCSGVTEIPQSECEALVDFYNAMGGENRGPQEGSYPNQMVTPWLHEGPICEQKGEDENWIPGGWDSVTCENGHVVEIGSSLSNLGLNGTIPDSIRNLTYLRGLSLGDNHVTGIGEGLKDLQHLKSLRLQGGDIEELSDSICYIPNLEGASFSLNKIKKLPSCIGNLDKAKSFDFSYNPIDEIPNSFCKIIENMDSFNVGYTNLSTLPECIQDATLDSIGMNNNKFTEIPNFIWNMQSLSIISFGNNQLTNLSEKISNLYRLSNLYLQDNNLATVPESLTLINFPIYNSCGDYSYRPINFERNNIFDPESIRILNQIGAWYNGQYQLKDLTGDIILTGTLEISPNENGQGDQDFSDGIDFTTSGNVSLHNPDSNKQDWMYIDLNGFKIKTDHGRWNGKIMPPMDNNGNGKGVFGDEGFIEEIVGKYHNVIVGNKVAGSEIDGLKAEDGYFHLYLYLPEATIGSNVTIQRKNKGESWMKNVPDNSCIVNNDHICYFRTDHLSYFSAVEPRGSEGNSYTVNFIDENGNEIQSTEVEYGTIPTYNSLEPAKLGYNYEWFPEIHSVDGDNTYQLKWTANNYTIKFNAGGGQGSMSEQIATYDSGIVLNANAFSRDGYTFNGWKDEINNKTYIDKQLVKNLINSGTIELTAQWKQNSNGSNGGGGGGGGGGGSSTSYSCKNLPSNATANNNLTPKSDTNYSYSTNKSTVCTFQCKTGYDWNKENNKCEKSDSQTITGDITPQKSDITINEGDLIDNDSRDLSAVQSDENIRLLIDLGTLKATEQEIEKYGLEQIKAYFRSYQNGITTMDSVKDADIEGGLNRIAMAKMLSQYAINILGKTPDTTKRCSFPDVSEELDKEYNNGVSLACQLGLMGVGINEFRPFDSVTRAEFATALSRMLYGTSDGEGAYYIPHLRILKENGIITNDDPNLQEVRGYVMLMLMRSFID